MSKYFIVNEHGLFHEVEKLEYIDILANVCKYRKTEAWGRFIFDYNSLNSQINVLMGFRVMGD